MERIQHVDRVRVLMDGRPVGTLAMTPEQTMAFQYDRAWIRDGFSISPLSLPLREGVFTATSESLRGAFGIFDDSMPDGWGRLLVDRSLAQQGIDPRGIGMLERLSIVGSSGMGALEYQPENCLNSATGLSDLDAIAEECARVLKTDYSPNLDELFDMGGSSGGARPKILVDIDGEAWIIKFASSVDPDDIGKREYELALLASRCGIEMPEVRLFPSKRSAGYFGVKRFDRVATPDGEKKVHMASVGALLETSHRIPNLEYELLMRLTSRMTDDAAAIGRLYRLMCFNVFVGNRDDHAKNFSYLYHGDEAVWRLAPGYDLTQNSGMNGEHATTVNGKGRDISLSDLMSVADGAGIKASVAKSVALEIHDAVEEAGYLIT